MVTVTSIKSGQWSATDTWDTGAVPADGDAVIISNGHDVVFDVDQSGFDTGLIGLSGPGNISFKKDTRTYLKMAANITLTGDFYVGTETNPILPPSDNNPVMATICFNGAFQITSSPSNLELWGEERQGYDTITTGGGSADTTLTLKDGLNLREGDVVYISHLTQGINATVHTVQSYNTLTKVVTFTSPLGRTIQAGRGVTLDSRNIQCMNLNKTGTAGFTNAKNNGKATGVRFFNFGRGPIDGRSGWIITSCTGNNNTNGGISYYGSGNTITGCTGNNNTAGGISYYGSGNTITGCTGNNNTSGGISTWGSGNTITGCTGNNNTSGGISYYGSGNTITGCTGNNNTLGGISYYGSGNTITGCTGNNNTLGGISHQGSGNTLIGCDDGVNNTGGTIFYPQIFKVFNHQSNSPVTLYNTNNNLKHHTLESWNTNQTPGNYKAWMNGGRIETENNKLKFICESNDYPVFRDYPILAPANRVAKFLIGLTKDTSGISTKLQIIDPANDPLIDTTATPLAESIATNTTEAQQIGVAYKSTTPKQIILRILCQNSSGNVIIDTTRIDQSLAKRIK